MTVKSGEKIVGTEDGVFRTAGIIRCAPDQRWSYDMIKRFSGTPDEPKLGSRSDVIPTYTKRKNDQQTVKDAFADMPREPAAQARAVYITAKDVKEHGASEGCKACESAMRRGRSTDFAHTDACRIRFQEIMRVAGSAKLSRADQRMDEAVFRASNVAEVPAAEKPMEMDADAPAAAPEPAASSSSTAPAPAPPPAPAPAAPRHRDPPPTEPEAAWSQRPERMARKQAASNTAEDGSQSLAVPRGRTHQQQPQQRKQPQSRGSVQQMNRRMTEHPPRAAATHRKKLAMSKGQCRARLWTRRAIRLLMGLRDLDAPVLMSSSDPPRNHDEVAKGRGVTAKPKPLCTGSVSWEPLKCILNREIESGGDATAPVDTAEGDDTVGTKVVMSHPGLIAPTEEITSKECQWQDVVSGTFARSFPRVKRLITTTRGGPPIGDVHRRTVWSLSKGRVIDDCIVDDVSDEFLNCELDQEDDIRVELIMKGAESMYRKIGADVAEVYYQPRIAQAAAMLSQAGVQLKPAWSLDLPRCDPTTGRAWGLSQLRVQSRVTKLLKESQPLFLIGSPPCTACLPLQNLSRMKRDPKVVEAEMEAARVHLRCCMRLYALQVREGRFFVHEHPAEASSWEEQCVAEIAAMDDVGMVMLDMCAFGMRVETANCKGLRESGRE